ncbi:hypothetical protein Droror1_Dr00009594 [Drosera rotundifolia]
MLNVQVRQVSVETIKPSTPTPDDRKTHKLCFLDQFMPALYTTIILFYNTSNAHDKVLQLKESLSQTLTKFYPLAGKIYEDNIVIDCNDEGIPFSVAHADFSLLEFLKEPNVQLLQHFLPSKRVPTKPITELPLLTIQVTVFTCGGLAIGGCFNHKILDGASIGCFLKNWAATLRGHDVGVVCPDFVAGSKDFPPIENIPSPGKKQLISPITYDSCKLRWYVFDQSAIQALKTEARSEKVPNPTRVEVVSAFMWKHLTAKSKYLNNVSTSMDEKTSLLSLAVNLRKHALSPNLKNSIGNLMLPTYATISSHQIGEELNVIIGKVHEAISRVDEEYVRKLHGEDGMKMMWESVELWSHDRETRFMCSSWCNLGIDDADFGWGKPLWVSPWGEPEDLERHLLVLMDRNGGGGIEAWIVLQEQEIVALESDEEFTNFAVPAIGICMPTS